MPSPTTPAEALEAKIAELDAEIERLRGEREVYERALAILKHDLTRDQSGSTNVTMEMHKTERLHHSKGARRTPRTRELRDAALASGHTLRSLAAELHTTHTQLSLAATGKRPIGRTMADRIAKLTGYAATLDNWPKLRD